MQVAPEEVGTLKSLTKPLPSTSIVTFGDLKSHIETCSAASEATKSYNKKLAEGRNNEEKDRDIRKYTSDGETTYENDNLTESLNISTSKVDVSKSSSQCNEESDPDVILSLESERKVYLIS